MQINQAFEILRDAGGIRAARIITSARPKLTRAAVWRMSRQLRRGVPVAKIIHEKWFYALPFYTNRFTLDPRPDTETLVSAVLADKPVGKKRILDIGTGTGCILAALVTNIPGASGIGIDKSYGAVRVARRNMRALGIADRVRIRWRSFNRPWLVAPFDIIVSNPPYIARGDVRVDDGARHDPAMALYANQNGYGAYDAIARRARDWMRDGGRIYLEIGMGQVAGVRQIFECAGWTFDRTERDLGGIDRVMVFRK